MGFWMNTLWECVNVGLMAGLVALFLVVLRPVLLRLFTAQQRVIIWLVALTVGHMPLHKRGAVLPVTLQTLIVPRTGQFFSPNPAFLPVAYEGPGAYNLALPGVGLVEVTLTDALVYGFMVLWLAVAAAVCTYSFFRGRKLTAQVQKGVQLGDNDPVFKELKLNQNLLQGISEIWITPGLPTSFVRFRWHSYNEVVVQAELPPEEMELVMLHEAQHVRLWHPWWKVLASMTLVLYWWNPLIWLGYRYFCRDMELACDAAVLKKLTPEQRRQYAKLLVELGSGRQLWEVPLAFGECDAAVRVKEAVRWKPRKLLLNVLTWCAAAFLILFLYGGQRLPYPAADLKLAYEREYGNMEQFVADLNLSLAQALDLQPVAVEKNCPDLGIVQVWEAPSKSVTSKTIDTDKLFTNMSDYKPGDGGWEIPYKTVTNKYAALWVQTRDGTWYHVPYGWWGEGTNTFFVLHAKVCEAPDLTGAYQLVG